MCLHMLVELEGGNYCNGSDEDFEDSDPDVCVMDAVGTFAVDASSHRYDGCDPEDD